jgi:predicted acylesterase/phospholipase RssA
MTIKHLVFSGGGPAGFIFYGALKELNKNKVWEFKNIESIYSTSIGSLIALIVILNYEWSWMDDFMIKRPWDKTLNLDNTDHLLNIINDKGAIGDEIISEVIKPLLFGRDLKENITLKELYEYSNIDFHIFTTNINTTDTFEKIDLSHKTYPNLTLFQAITMSVSIPIIFKSICIDNKCYMDGGITNNFPLNDCLNDTNCHNNEILAFFSNTTYNSSNITNDTSTIDYLMILLRNIIIKLVLDNTSKQANINNILNCGFSEDFKEKNFWIEPLINIDFRIKIIKHGETIAQEFYKKNFSN